MEYISKLPDKNFPFPRKIVICGSTGSIGVNSLRIIEKFPQLFSVLALGAGKNIQLLAKQALQFLPEYLVVQSEELIAPLKELLTANSLYKPTILWGQEGYESVAGIPDSHIFVSAQVGAAGLRATVQAAAHGKIIALANKESLVLAGNLIRRLCKENQSVILPIDSEHHALFKCLEGQDTRFVRKLTLTASGGALWGKDKEFLKQATAKDALKHPNWTMGAKITIDSATLMNKGFEVIEACHLYGVDLSFTDVIIHRESIVHSLVEYSDYSFLAQLSTPDMRLPIAHCLAYPTMLSGFECDLPTLNLAQKSLTFYDVDNDLFPCLNIAKNAYIEKKCIALNAANEIAVDAFLDNHITFLEIPSFIEKIIEKSEVDSEDISSIIEQDKACRALAKESLKRV